MTQTTQNETVQSILSRRSTRSFTAQPIPKEILETLAQCAVYAPSGMGLQTWKFTVVTDQAMIRQLCSAIEKTLNRPGYDMYRPTALLIPSNERGSKYGKEDNACALENIFVAAHSYGIGSVWINQLQNICDEPAIRKLLDDMEIPADHVVYGLAALGYGAGELPARSPKKGQVHWVE